MTGPRAIIFYSIERAIKTYRQFAQRRLVEAGSSLTVDQWLILNVIRDEPGIQQGGIADLVFKDRASIARMVALLVKAGYLKRSIPAADRRTVRLELTNKAGGELALAEPVVSVYREQALKGVKKNEIAAMDVVLKKIMDNCHE